MITILHEGIYCSIQDLGRFGYQKDGVVLAGGMDSVSLRIANLLVGNEENEATLEVTFGKTAIQFHSERIIAITGGDLQATLNGMLISLFQPIYVKKDDILKFNIPSKGFRAYVAISGGMDLPFVLKSKSTDHISNFGGFNGRTLRSGDDIALKKHRRHHLNFIQTSKSKISWYINHNWIYNFDKMPTIHVIPGKEFHLFDRESLMQFENDEYTISPNANRMGYRLESHRSLQLKSEAEILSEAVTFGTVQVPPNGKPIILMADAQTIGGYPKIGQVIQSDFSTLAQKMPGQKMKFKFISIEEAEHLLIKREKLINLIKLGIMLKMKKRFYNQ